MYKFGFAGDMIYRPYAGIPYWKWTLFYLQAWKAFVEPCKLEIVMR